MCFCFAPLLFALVNAVKTQADNKRWVSLSERHFCCKTKWFFFQSCANAAFNNIVKILVHLYRVSHECRIRLHVVHVLAVSVYFFVRSVSLSHSVSPGSLTRAAFVYLLYTWTLLAYGRFRLGLCVSALERERERDNERERHTRQQEIHSERVKKHWWR